MTAAPARGTGQDDRGRWLILLLDPELAHVVLPADPGTDVVLDGRRFVDVAGDGFNWFADRLFDRSGRCVGVELTPLVPLLENVPESIARLRYVTVIDTGIPNELKGEHRFANRVQLRIFFGGGPIADVEMRGDQAFLGRVLADEDARFALAFESEFFLDPADVDGLSALGVRAVEP